MKRRVVLSSATSVAALLAGCTGTDEPADTRTTSPNGTPPDASTDHATDSPPGTDTETDPATEDPSEHDALVRYTATVQDGPSGEYELPEPAYDEWSWLVMDLEVVEGELSMQDVWFNAFFETSERLYAVAHDSSDVEDGIESRGSIREGGRGVVLHDYPPAPRGQLSGWNTSVMEGPVGGDGVNTDGPGEMYPPVSVEYAIETAANPDVLPDEYAERRGDEEVWAVVSIDVTEGYLNMEDVWFRSRLVTGSRRHEISHSSQHAERGVWSRGMVKAGNTAHALFRVGAGESMEEWEYTEDGRQDVTLSRA